MSLPGKSIPLISSFPDRSTFANKPKVFIDVNFHTFLKGQHTSPVENITAKEEFVQTVKEVTDQSKLFSGYTLDRFDSKDCDLTIQIDMLNHGDYTMALLSGCISGLSLTLIPVAAKDNYTLTAKLLDKEGNVLKSYVYDDYVRTWFHLFLFPFVGTLKTVPDDVMGNMVKNLYNDILNDNYLQYSYRESELPEFLCINK